MRQKTVQIKILDCYTFKKFLDRVFSVLMFSQSLFQVIKQSILTGLSNIYVRDPGRNQTNHIVTGIFICAPDVQNHIKPNVDYTCLNKIMSNSFSSNGC